MKISKWEREIILERKQKEHLTPKGNLLVKRNIIWITDDN